MKSADVIIAGAGAAGLMIAKKLTEAGKTVILLEARERLGGRIHTVENSGFIMPVESGAEFIHGNLPVTLGLLREAGIEYRDSGGDTWHAFNGALTQDDEFMGEADILGKKLNELTVDTNVAAFLENNFEGEEHHDLRQMVTGFVEGYDAADINTASTFALRNEWQETSGGDQYRVNGGYISLIRFLESVVRKNGCFISIGSIVKTIQWQRGSVTISTDAGDVYSAEKAVITVPLGILLAEKDSRAAITFSPALADTEKLFKLLGFGGVIKILLLFRKEFWNEIVTEDGKNMKDLGWLLSREAIPTWWAQTPDKNGLLTGWLAGPKVSYLKDLGDDTILEIALESLGNIFGLGTSHLKEMLVHSKVVNWLADPFSLGAYSFATTATREVVKQLGEPIQNTLFFAGEAMYDGEETGTVEAALANGAKVARQLLEQ